MTGVNLALQHVVSITGKVTGADGEPLPNTRVIAFGRGFSTDGDPQFTHAGEADSDESGQYRIVGVKPGTYLVRAVPPLNRIGLAARVPAGSPSPDSQPQPADTWYPSNDGPSSGVAVNVRAGQDTGGIDIRIVYALKHHIRGTVARATSGAIYVSTIRLPSLHFDGGRSAAVQANGSFDIKAVPSGTYRLQVLRTEGVKTTLIGTGELTVGDQDVDGVVMDAGGLPNVSGTLHGTNAPQTLMLQVLHGDDREGTSTKIAPDGKFTFERVQVMRYRLNGYALPPNSYIASVKLNGREAIDTGLDFTAGVTGDLDVTIANDAGKISGIVADKDGQPVEIEPTGALDLHLTR